MVVKKLLAFGLMLKVIISIFNREIEINFFLQRILIWYSLNPHCHKWKFWRKLAKQPINLFLAKRLLFKLFQLQVDDVIQGKSLLRSRTSISLLINKLKFELIKNWAEKVSMSLKKFLRFFFFLNEEILN